MNTTRRVRLVGMMLAALLAVPLAVPLSAQLTPEQKRLNTESFEKIWTTIRDKHWEKNPGGLDWQAIHQEYRPKIDQAENMEDARKVMRDMLDRLHETHFGIIPSSTFGEVDAGDQRGDGSTGIELRVLGHQAVVTRIDPGSPAEKAGVKTGWVVLSAEGKDLAPVIEKLQATQIIHELQVERVIESRVSGPVGGKIHVVFLDGANKQVPLDLTLGMPRGELTRFGNLPPEFVWIETRKIDGAAYIRFNLFLDLVRVMSKFSDTVGSCLQCDGVIIDLRGNPGGIGGMAMGMAGWFLDIARSAPGHHGDAGEQAEFRGESSAAGVRGTGGDPDGRKLGVDLGDFRGRVEGPGPGSHLRHAVGRRRAAQHHRQAAERRRIPVRHGELHFGRRKSSGGQRGYARSGSEVDAGGIARRPRSGDRCCDTVDS